MPPSRPISTCAPVLWAQLAAGFRASTPGFFTAGTAQPCTDGRQTPEDLTLQRRSLCICGYTQTQTPPGFLLLDFSTKRVPPLVEELWRLLPAHSSPGTSESEPAYGFNDESAAGLLGRASPAAPQLSLGVTRTVTASENPWDLVLIVTRMAPSVGFFQAASPQPCVTDHVQECGSSH